MVVSFFPSVGVNFFVLSQILLYNDLHPKNNLSINSIQDHIFVAEKLQRLVSGFFHSRRFQIDNICNRLRYLKSRLKPRTNEFLENNTEVSAEILNECISKLTTDDADSYSLRQMRNLAML